MLYANCDKPTTQTPHSVAFDQGLHVFLHVIPIKRTIRLNEKANYVQWRIQRGFGGSL